jgi:hypothetical protein
MTPGNATQMTGDAVRVSGPPVVLAVPRGPAPVTGWDTHKGEAGQ